VTCATAINDLIAADELYSAGAQEQRLGLIDHLAVFLMS
jgi:hypothetical protein